MSSLQTMSHFGVDSKSPVVVTAIEAGPIEKQVIILIESLRLWGGRLAKVPVVAVQSRRGPAVRSATKLALDQLEVEFLRIERNDQYEWFPYLNKTAALAHVAAKRTNATVIWLDADTLIIDEPSELILNTAIAKFAACASNKNIGTSDDSDAFAPYFRNACSALGVDYASLPYICTEEDHARIRMYWNSGVYAFESNSGLAELHHRFTLSLVEKGIASHESGLFFSDQIGLGLAVHRLGLPFHCLPLSHNFSLQPTTAVSRLSNPFPAPRILHYHGSLWPQTFFSLCDALSVVRPDVASWLRAKGPLSNDLPLTSRAQKKLLEIVRRGRLSLALRRATYY